MVNENDEAVNTEQPEKMEEPVKAAAKKVAKKKAVKKVVKKTSAKKVAEKVNDLGAMSENLSEQEVSERHFPWALYILLAFVSFGLAGIYIYKHQAQQTQAFVKNDSATPSAETANSPEEMPGSTTATSSSQASHPNMMEPPAWVVEQRAKMKERADQNTPDWVKEQRAQMEKQMKQQRANNWSQSEPPAWMKQRQAQMKKWASQQSPNWVNQPPQWNPPQQMTAPAYGPAYYYPPQQQAYPVAPGYRYGPYYGPAR